MSAVLALPRVVVDAAGGPLEEAAAASLAEVRVQRALSAPALCELTFVDPPPAAAVATSLAPGTTLRVRVPDRDEPLFAGEVTAVEYVYDPDRGREIRVRGYDLLHRLRKRQTPRVHLETTAADLASEMAAEVGLGADALESGPVWPRIIQHRQSDLELLLDVCERSGLFLTVDGDTLRVITLAGTGETVALELGGTLIEASIETNGDPAIRSVSVVGWDLGRIEPHRAVASEARSGRTAEAEVAPDEVGASGERTFLDEGVTDDALALALAQAELDLRVAGEVVLRGIALGDPRLRPGVAVEIPNVDAGLAGSYVLTEVRHTIDREGGFVSEISSAPPDVALRRRGAMTTAGIVESVDDPDGLGRVQVRLPSFGDVETGWLGVVSVGAGSGKGMVALPDAGDRVLVLLANEDPAQAIVLGGLYGAEGPFDSGVVSGTIQRYSLRTPGGRLVRLDDENQTIRVEDSQGNFVELTPDELRVHSESRVVVDSVAELTIRAGADLTIEAPGKAIRIRAKSIDFETA